MDYPTDAGREGLIVANNLIRASLCIFVVVAANVAAAESLGRLFFTPKERAALDRGKAGQLAELVELTPAEPKRPVEMNGYVARSDGKATVWMDGEPRYRQEAATRLDPAAVQTRTPIHVRRSPISSTEK